MRKKCLFMFIFLCCMVISGCKKENDVEEITSNETFLTVDKIDIEIEEVYNVQVMLKEEFATSSITFKSNNSSIFSIQNQQEIIGKKEGKAQLQIFDDQGKRQGITIQVFAKNALKDTFSMDKGRLYQKNVLFYGDSITQYEQWEGEYVLHLKDYYQFEHQNFAKSGTTIAYSSRYQGKENGVTYMYHHQQEHEWADYVFILYGTNDIDEATPVGIRDAEMLTNYDDKNPTYKGAINYAVKILREHNPNLRIIFLELLYRSVPIVQDFNKALRNQCYYNEVKFIPLYDLWNAENVSVYSNDGLHPNSQGNLKMFERIISC